MLDFTSVINRCNTDSWKWDAPIHAIGRKDLIQMGCADMDFVGPPEIAKALSQAAATGLYGYTMLNDAFRSGVQSWYAQRHNCPVDKQSIVYIPRIVMAASLFVEAFSRPGDSIILSAPYYPPLHDAAVNNGRNIIEPALVERDGRYVMDFEALEKQVTKKTKAFIFVSPHNPTGRVFTREELEQVASFCVAHDLMLFVDEIHSDFVTPGHKFISCASLKGDIEQKLIVINAPSKTFNVMGCHASYLIIPNAKVRAQMVAEIERSGLAEPNFFANAMMKCAYQECGYYVDEVNKVIDANDEYLREKLTALFPKAKITTREGTFLLWVDFNEVFASEDEMYSFFLNKAGVVLLKGSNFSKQFAGFARINLGCPRATLEEVVARIAKALQDQA